MKKHLTLLVILLSCLKASAQDGSLDTSFTAVEDLLITYYLTPDNNGNVYICGSFIEGKVRRLLPNGDNDSSFANLDITSSLDGWGGRTVKTMYVQSDNSLLVGGRFEYMGRECLVRVNSQGVIDSGFNFQTPGETNPQGDTAGDFEVRDIAIQPTPSGDKILIVGRSMTGDPHIYRINYTTGAIDNTFNTNGANDAINSITVLPNGDLIVVGEFTTYNGYSRNKIARLDSNGNVQSNYNYTGASGDLYTVELDSNNKILIGGTNTLKRLNSDLTVDNSFASSVTGEITVIDLFDDGNIMVCGNWTNLNGTTISSQLAKMNDTGTLDPCFTDYSTYSQELYTMAIYGDAVFVGSVEGSYQGVANEGTIKIKGNTTINAVDDIGTTVYSNNGGVAVTNVLGGNTPDTINNENATLSNVTLTQISTTNPGVTLNTSNGSVNVAPNTPSGSYTLVYKICEKLVGCVCDEAQVTITVESVLTPGLRANNIVTHSALQSTGKIVTAGYFTAYNNVPVNKIARLNSDLTLDSSFNSSGPAPAATRPLDIAVLSDNSIIVAGQFSGFSGGSNGSCIAKLLPNGNIDTSFNSGQAGAAATDSNQQISTVAVQPDGKILIGGYFHSYDGLARNHIARLLPNGFPDTSFAIGTGFNGYVNDIVVQSDGKIVVVGSFNSYQGIAVPGIIRLHANGSIDAAFLSAVGSGISGVGPVAQSKYVQLQPDGKIILYGIFTTFNGVSRNNIARLNTNGSLDTSFNPGAGFNAHTRAIAIEPSGKIFVGGDFTTYNGTSVNTIIRLNTNGSLDASFSSGTGPAGPVWNLTRQQDAKVIVGGQFTTYNGISATFITRIQPTIPGGQARGIDHYESEPEIDMSVITDIEGINLSKKVSIYPNPSQGIFNLQMDGYEGETFELTVYNTLGQTIIEKTLTGENNYQIDLTGQNTGNYFIKFANNNTVINKIIVKK